MIVDDAIVFRNVQTGRRDGEMIEILSGLERHEQVIKDIAGLGRGLPVKVVSGRSLTGMPLSVWVRK